MIIPPTLKPENVKRLVEIQNRLYVIEMADRMTREEQNERRALIAEREKIRRGRDYGRESCDLRDGSSDPGNGRSETAR